MCHILEDGRLETHDEVLERLLEQHGMQEEDLFLSRDERIEEAYRLQEADVAYVNPERVASWTERGPCTPDRV